MMKALATHHYWDRPGGGELVASGSAVALLPLVPLIEDEDYVPGGIDYGPGEWE